QADDLARLMSFDMRPESACGAAHADGLLDVAANQLRVKDQGRAVNGRRVADRIRCIHGENSSARSDSVYWSQVVSLDSRSPAKASLPTRGKLAQRPKRLHPGRLRWPKDRDCHFATVSGPLQPAHRAIGSTL